MLTIELPANEFWNSETQEFTQVLSKTIDLEHSLISLSKWESKWKIPFLGDAEKTDEQTLDYIRMMTITRNVDPNIYYGLTPELIKQITEYTADSMTATTFSHRQKSGNSGSVITSELIYFWMISLNIPVEFERWHLRRLLTLIEVCHEKSKDPKKRSRSEILAQNKSLNAARRKKLGTRG